VRLDAGITANAVVCVLAWLRERAIKTLNVTGPRKSKQLGFTA
jgi:hypothetical protein